MHIRKVVMYRQSLPCKQAWLEVRLFTHSGKEVLARILHAQLKQFILAMTAAMELYNSQPVQIQASVSPPTTLPPHTEKSDGVLDLSKKQPGDVSFQLFLGLYGLNPLRANQYTQKYLMNKESTLPE